jgi:hypothetical protein
MALESTCALLLYLEAIKHVMVEKQNKKLKAKGKAATAQPEAKGNPKRKVSGGLTSQVPKKGCSEKFCQRCKAHCGPCQTHNTLDCPCYDSNGKPLEAAAGKPSESNKPYKKFGGDKSMAFMQHMFEAYAKSQKKAGKSKKGKRHDNNSSDSSNSEKETGYDDTGFSVDKHLKIDQPFGTVYLSTVPHLIKVTATAPSDNTRANEIAIKTAKTSKVTAVVAVMRFFCKKRCNLRDAISGDKKLSCQKAESTDVLEENSHGSRNLSLKTRKGWSPKKLASKSKKLELNCTNLKLNSKKTHSDCAKKPDPSVSSGLKVKNKTIRVLLDSGSSGDLLFLKKGSSKCISVTKWVVPQL